MSTRRRPKRVTPLPPGMAVGDFWRNLNNPLDAGFIISIDWGEDECAREAWVATFRWLHGARNKHNMIFWLGGWQAKMYERLAWGELDPL